MHLTREIALFFLLRVSAGAVPGERNPEEPLILTPFIALGNVKEARRLAMVGNINATVLGYSAFLTINQTCNSNMFFWFFPSQNDINSDPVAVWLNGGPGSSSLLGLFSENGPCRLTVEGDLIVNEFSWNRNSSLLYVDNPVGTGFSFTDSLDCYCTNEIQVADDFLIFLEQFFQLFPELKNNKFYLTGESYAGKYIPAIAYAIFTRNASLHLDGIAIGNGLIDPINQLHYSEHFYRLGLTDEKIKQEMEKAESEVRNLVRVGNFSEAATKRSDLISVVFGKRAGYTDFYNFLFSDGVPKGNIRKFLNQKEVRIAIHVGNIPYANSTVVSSFLYHDIMQSVRPWLEFILGHCRVLLYYGQMDLRDSYVASRDFISDLDWNGRDSFKKSERKLWKVDDELAGYARSFDNLTEVMVRNAGHFVPMDQPKWALDMYNRFLFNEPYN